MNHVKRIASVVITAVTLAGSGVPSQAAPAQVAHPDLPEPDVIWGASSNSLCAGIYCPGGTIRLNAKTGAVLTNYSLAIGNISTGKIHFFWPPPDQRDDFVLTDAKSGTVPKTPLGQAFGRSGTAEAVRIHEWKRKKYVPYWLEPKSDALYDFTIKPEERIFNLRRYFYVTNRGDYTLTRYARV